MPRRALVGVQVWLVASGRLSARRLFRLGRILTRSERARLRQIQSRESRIESLVGRALIRRGLALYTGIPAHLIALRDAPNGKPEIAEAAWAERIRFNVSHARGLVGCAFTRHPFLGLDLERAHDALDIDAIADLHFTRAEAADLRARSGPARVRRFLTYWTLKEAYLKAIGVGLTVPLREAAIAVGARGSPRLQTWQPIHWQLTARSHGSHVLAVAVSTGARAAAAGREAPRVPIRIASGARLLSREVTATLPVRP